MKTTWEENIKSVDGPEIIIRKVKGDKALWLLVFSGGPVSAGVKLTLDEARCVAANIIHMTDKET